MEIHTPIEDRTMAQLRVGDPIEIHGVIYCGRDAVLPRLATLIENDALQSIKVSLEGAVIFHTAVSPAGIGPTTSNKVDIEGSIPALSRAGVKVHLGKGSLSEQTVEVLKRYGTAFAITPPVSALFREKIVSQRVVAFKEEGMEALYELVVRGLPAIIAVAHGRSIFSSHGRMKLDHAQR